MMRNAINLIVLGVSIIQIGLLGVPQEKRTDHLVYIRVAAVGSTAITLRKQDGWRDVEKPVEKGSEYIILAFPPYYLHQTWEVETTPPRLPYQVSLLGDVDGDGKVTGMDRKYLTKHFGYVSSECDLNMDGEVDDHDMRLLMMNYNFWNNQ